MVNKEELVNGILRYIDDEVIPHLPTGGKWVLGSLVFLITERSNVLLEQLLSNELIKTLNIVDSNSMIDADRLIQALKKSANKYGKLVVTIPIVGTMSFTESDVDTLRLYLEEASNDRTTEN